MPPQPPLFCVYQVDFRSGSPGAWKMIAVCPDEEAASLVVDSLPTETFSYFYRQEAHEVPIDSGQLWPGCAS